MKRPWKVEVRDAAEGAFELTIKAASEEEALEEAAIAAAERGCQLVSEIIAQDALALQVSAKILSLPHQALAAMSIDTIQNFLDEKYPAEVITAVMKGLTDERPALVREVWLIDSEDAGVELEEEYLSHWRETGELICPIAGEPVADPDSHVWVEWQALPRDPAPQPGGMD